MRRLATRLAVCAAVAASLVACSGDSDEEPLDTGDVGVETGATDAPPPPRRPSPSPCDAVLKVAGWPGGGVQVTIEVADPLVEFGIVDGDGQALTVAVEPFEEASGITAILVVPAADPTEHAARLARAGELVKAVPAAERVGVWVSGETLWLACELTSAHGHVLERIDAIPLGPAGSRSDDAATVAGILRAVSGGAGPVRRGVVTVDSGDASAAPRGALRRVGACPQGGTLGLELTIGEESCPLSDIAPLVHLAEQPCVSSEAALDSYPYGDTVGIHLEPAEQQQLADYKASEIRDDITARITLGDSALIDATFHLRGSTSLSQCERNSLTVDLDSSLPRRLMPGGADDRFHLISLCKDDRYYHQAVAFELMRELGCFPLDTRFVTLTVGGKHLGVYLMVEHVRDTLVADRVGVVAVVRRRFDPGDAPEEVKFPKDAAGADVALAQYHELVALVDNNKGPELLPLLQERMALDRYLDWIALNTLLRNGDYIDEAYFHASAEGQGSWYWRAAGWDPDDLMMDCHHKGQHAVATPHDLVYCAEADLDRALIHSDAVFARYVDRLESLLTERVSAAHLSATVQRVRAQLFEALDDDATAAAMVELVAANPSASTAAGAKADIGSHMDGFVAAVEARRQVLLEGIAAYRAGSK